MIELFHEYALCVNHSQELLSILDAGFQYQLTFIDYFQSHTKTFWYFTSLEHLSERALTQVLVKLIITNPGTSIFAKLRQQGVNEIII